MVSECSDGEFISLNESDESDTPTVDYQSDSDQSQITDTMNFLNIKMMSTFSDLPSLLHQRSVLEQKLKRLTPGQFQLLKRYQAQIALLSSQIA